MRFSWTSAAATFEDAVKLLTKMRLRARVTLDDAGEDLAVVAVGGEEPGVRSNRTRRPLDADAPCPTSAPASSLLAFLPPDPRLASLGLRGVLPRAVAEALIEGGVEMARTHGRSRRKSTPTSVASAVTSARRRRIAGCTRSASLRAPSSSACCPWSATSPGSTRCPSRRGATSGRSSPRAPTTAAWSASVVVPASFHHHIIRNAASKTERANERSASPLFVAPGSRLFPMEEEETAPATSARAKPAGSVVASSGDVGLAITASVANLKHTTHKTGTTGDGGADALAHSTTLTARFIARDELQSRASSIATRVWTPPWWDARWTSRSDDAEA